MFCPYSKCMLLSLVLMLCFCMFVLNKVQSKRLWWQQQEQEPQSLFESGQKSWIMVVWAFLIHLRIKDSILVKWNIIMSPHTCLLSLHALIFHHKPFCLSIHVSLCPILSSWGNTLVQRAHYLHLIGANLWWVDVWWVDVKDLKQPRNTAPGWIFVGGRGSVQDTTQVATVRRGGVYRYMLG